MNILLTAINAKYIHSNLAVYSLRACAGEYRDAVELAEFLNRYGFVPDQVQDFYPTPATLATCMYYTEMNPFTGESVYVAKDMEEKKERPIHRRAGVDPRAGGQRRHPLLDDRCLRRG